MNQVMTEFIELDRRDQVDGDPDDAGELLDRRDQVDGDPDDAGGKKQSIKKVHGDAPGRGRYWQCPFCGGTRD